MMSKMLLHSIFRMRYNIGDFLFPGLDDGGCVGVAEAEVVAMPGSEEVVAAYSTCDQPFCHMNTTYAARKSYDFKNLINKHAFLIHH